MKINTVFPIAALLAAVSTPLFAASACGPDGKPAERVSVVQDGGQFHLLWQPGKGRAEIVSEPITGEFNAAAGLDVGPGGFPVAASYVGSDQKGGYALWFQGRKVMQFAGLLSRIRFASTGAGGAIVAHVANPEVRDAIEVHTLYSRDGRRLAERRMPWDPERFGGFVFSVRGDVVHMRYGSGMSPAREVTLYDSRSFEPVASIALAGEHINDVVVIDRRKAFFTARGGVFLYENDQIRSIGEPGAPMYHERLDLDPHRERLLSFGPGGYQAFSWDGRPLSKRFHGGVYFGADGFAHDGSIIVGAEFGKAPYRLIDPLTAEVLAVLPPGRLHPANGGERIDCVGVDGIFHKNDFGEPKLIRLQRQR